MLISLTASTTSRIQTRHFRIQDTAWPGTVVFVRSMSVVRDTYRRLRSSNTFTCAVARSTTRLDVRSLCIQFKVAVLVYRVLHGLAPQYLGPLTHVSNLPGRRALRSAGTTQLDIPFVRLSTVGGRAFDVDGRRIWNSLPAHVISAETLTTVSYTHLTLPTIYSV